MATTMITLDNREHELIKLFPGYPVAQLPVGDIWIGSPETTEYAVVAERKTVADLEASLTDGRYREQRTRLLTFCAEKKARPLYIIEGSLSNNPKKKVLWQVLARLCMRYGVGLVQTSSIRETAELVETIAHQLTEDKECFKADTLSYSDVVHFTKKANADDPQHFTLAALQQCSGISLEKARALLATFKSLEGLLGANEAAIGDVKVNGRRLGQVVAARLFGQLHYCAS